MQYIALFIPAPPFTTFSSLYIPLNPASQLPGPYTLPLLSKHFLSSHHNPSPLSLIYTPRSSIHMPLPTILTTSHLIQASNTIQLHTILIPPHTSLQSLNLTTPSPIWPSFKTSFSSQGMLPVTILLPPALIFEGIAFLFTDIVFTHPFTVATAHSPWVNWFSSDCLLVCLYVNLENMLLMWQISVIKSLLLDLLYYIYCYLSYFYGLNLESLNDTNRHIKKDINHLKTLLLKCNCSLN